MKRIKIVPDRPNRLFESWLEEWRNEAVLRNSELRNHFTKALDSLKRYPLPLESGKECIILQHFGTKLCSMLDKKLEEHRRRESTKAVDASNIVSKDDGATTRGKKPEEEEECKILEVQKKTVVEQSKNIKKNASRRSANANKIATDANRQISLEPNAFDIILLVDTQETSG